MATTENTTGFKTFQATNAAIAAFIRVTVDSNGLISASAHNGLSIGVTLEAIAANGYGTVKLYSAPGTFLHTAASAITRGAALYPAANGKVDDTGTTVNGFVALQAAGGDGEVIETTRAIVGAAE